MFNCGFPCMCRPFRPRPKSDQTGEDQAAAPEHSQEQEELKPREASEGPQTNGEVGEAQKQRRQMRPRRQRNSESSASKVSWVVLVMDIVAFWKIYLKKKNILHVNVYYKRYFLSENYPQCRAIMI